MSTRIPERTQTVSPSRGVSPPTAASAPEAAPAAAPTTPRAPADGFETRPLGPATPQQRAALEGAPLAGPKPVPGGQKPVPATGFKGTAILVVGGKPAPQPSA